MTASLKMQISKGLALGSHLTRKIERRQPRQARAAPPNRKETTSRKRHNMNELTVCSPICLFVAYQTCWLLLLLFLLSACNKCQLWPVDDKVTDCKFDSELSDWLLDISSGKRRPFLLAVILFVRSQADEPKRSYRHWALVGFCNSTHSFGKNCILVYEALHMNQTQTDRQTVPPSTAVIRQYFLLSSLLGYLPSEGQPTMGSSGESEPIHYDFNCLAHSHRLSSLLLLCWWFSLVALGSWS